MLAGVHLDGAALVTRARRHREGALVVAQLGAVVGERDLRRDHLLLVVRRRLRAEDGQQDRLRPVDVEVPGVAGLATVREDVPPPGVGLRHVHADVVRHDVEQEPQTPLPHGGDEGTSPLLAAALAGDPRGVDDVVSVVRPGARLQQRRRVQRPGAQRVQVGQELHPVREGGVGRELDPVGGGGDHRSPSLRSLASPVTSAWSRSAAARRRTGPAPGALHPPGPSAGRPPRRRGRSVRVSTSPTAVSTTIAQPRPVLRRGQRDLDVLVVGVEAQQERVVGDPLTPGVDLRDALPFRNTVTHLPKPESQSCSVISSAGRGEPGDVRQCRAAVPGRARLIGLPAKNRRRRNTGCPARSAETPAVNPIRPTFLPASDQSIHAISLSWRRRCCCRAGCGPSRRRAASSARPGTGTAW